MNDETKRKQDEVLAALGGVDGIEVTEINMTEYRRGDPTMPNSTVTGAEISLTAFYSSGDGPDDDNPFRIK